MMASMGPGFGHPNMQGHPGVPGGHPMGPGMPHNPSQQGGPGGGMPPQLGGHMGVSGAPANQVPTSLMGSMPPVTGGPNAHALQHLNPSQAQMFPQQQLHGPMQVQLQQQQQQQYLQQQHQARQALLAQQLHGNMGGVNGMPMGMAMGQMNPAQMAAMRQGMRPGAQNPHAQALMAQRMAMQQHQQAQSQNQHMVPGNTPGQPMQMTPQQLQNLQNQQAQIAAASMQAQASNQGQHQQRPQPQGQPQHPGQQTPQTSQAQVQVGTPAQSGGQRTPSQTPGPTPTPQNQQQREQQQQQQQAQAQAQAQGQPQGQPQGQQGQQQGQPQNQQQQQAQLQNAAMQAQMNAAAHQMAMNNNLGLQHQRTPAEIRSNCLLKLMQFSEHLSGYPGPKGKGDLSYWNDFVRTFFSPRGVFRHWVHISEEEQKTDKQYEIAFPALARYFHTYFESGVKTMQFVMDKGTTERPMPNGFSIENNRSSFVYWFENGLHLVATGSMRAQFDENYKLDVLEFSTTGHEEFVSLRSVIRAAKPAHDWVKDWHKMNSQDAKSSPEMSKKAKAKQMKSPQTAPPDALVDLPGSAVKKSMGIPEAVFQFLETAEVMGQMIPLFGYCHSRPSVSARTALEQYVGQHIPTVNNPQQPTPNPRPQNFPMGMGASPAMAQMQLPGSPHVGSPAPGTMQAPGMAMQKSHQGTASSGGPSANTSPASNKRRRPSTVKEEEGTPVINGAGKKPPTPRMPKKAKTGQ